MWFFKRIDAPDQGVTYDQNPDFWILPGRFTLGRAVGSDAVIRVHSPSVSRSHGVITCSPFPAACPTDRPTLHFEGICILQLLGSIHPGSPQLKALFFNVL
jgi:hypothetical protein